MEKVYQPQKYEEKIYHLWEKKGYFTPTVDKKKKPFCIIMPPPNANAPLHVGHALFVTLEDILIRYHRMKGKPTLWLPGADHAGILTQVVFEKELAKQGLSRFDLGREKFFQACMKFTQKNKKIMYAQLRRLGASCDWKREKFTLDPKVSRLINQTFKKMRNDGLIYQGKRIINWCPRCQTALSDLEVQYQEKKAKLYHIKYGKSVVVATTRPETMLGDTAVAVHPQDKRYQDLLGKAVILPLVGRKIPIIADKVVDPKFGTGAVKVTPAHDPTDFEIGQNHQLKIISVIGFDGKMKNAGQYNGLKTEKAREVIVAGLKKKRLLTKIEDYTHRVGHCERCRTVIEPLISKQWFIKTKPLAKPAIEAVRSGKIKIIPKRFEKIYFHWMDNIKDWCISRQIWWGHKIPIKTETDTLDTWFSSGQWPFATLRASPYKGDFEYFYPTSVMETGYEILFFWVARMIMLGLYVTKKVPFKTVYLHGMVRDAFGKKMSKSRPETCIDPSEALQEYGADALRMALVMGNAPGTDSSLTKNKIKGMRNFANKIWNASRFIISRSKKVKKPKRLEKEDKKMLKTINNLIVSVIKNFNQYRFDLAAEELYQVFWHHFCDRYLEAIKTRQNDPSAQWTLLVSLKTFLKLLHPFMPFLTESIWQKTKTKNEPDLIVAPWPEKISFD
jgi:valyl-tRNA synthetase